MWGEKQENVVTENAVREVFQILVSIIDNIEHGVLGVPAEGSP